VQWFSTGGPQVVPKGSASWVDFIFFFDAVLRQVQFFHHILYSHTGAEVWRKKLYHLSLFKLVYILFNQNV
jgi:hypothetical protein